MPGLSPLDAPLFIDAELPSTMDAARWRAVTGAPHGTLVLALQQTGGRGRYGNTWNSPAGGLYLSLILRPATDAPHEIWRDRQVPWLALQATLAMHRLIRPLLSPLPSLPQGRDEKLGIKWPNDLYAGGKKLSGVLVEAGLDPLKQPFAIVGLGLNVTASPDLLPPGATSLSKLLGWDRTLSQPAHAPAPTPPVSIPNLARRWREQFFAVPAPGEALESALLEVLLGLGEPVTLGWRTAEQSSPAKTETTSGRLVGLGSRAEIILEGHDGKRLTVSEGHLIKWSIWTALL